jgi:DNA end-binding protein Ku
MPPRAHWRGFLKLSFVSCSVALYPAVATEERLSFRRVNRQTGNRLRQRLVDEGTGEIIQRDQSGRGYQVNEKEFLIVEDAELRAAEEEARNRPFVRLDPVSEEDGAKPTSSKFERRQQLADAARALNPNHSTFETHRSKSEVPVDPDPVLIQPAKIENNRTIEIDRFVASEQINSAYFQTPYYIAPRGAIGEEAFAVIRDTLREKKVFAMGRVVLARRERPIIIEPLGLGLRGVTLRFAHEIRDPVEYFREIPELRLPQEMLRIAEHIVDAKMSAFDTAYLEDRYRTAVLSKLKERHDTSWKVGAVTPSQENIINLMDALKRSLGSEKMPPKPSARQRGAKMSKNQGSKLGKR